jgi:predicted SAM-dependent methyltransferase
LNLIKLDLGCGNNKKAGFLGIDRAPLKGVDILCDVDRDGIPLADGIVAEVFSSHFLEHMQNFRFVVEEIHRILVVGGKAEIIVPHFSNVGSYHWTHRSFWNARGLDLLQPGHPHHFYCPNVAFRIKIRNVEFCQKREYQPTLLERFASVRRGIVYERVFSSVIRAYQVRVVLEKMELD